MHNLTATYSPEDNKLRLRADDRLGDDLYEKVKALGFRWAPIQKLFVAPSWSPKREDLCLELAGFITAEGTTLAERAEAKAERLSNLAEKRSQQANTYRAAAERISRNFAAGQPILMGHHSQRKAEKNKQAMENNQAAAEKAADAVDYWSYRAQGVAQHANAKNNLRTRLNRIKGLLKDLRDYQRTINHGAIVEKLWTMVNTESDNDKRKKLVEHYVGGAVKTGYVVPQTSPSYFSRHREGTIADDQIIDDGISYGQQLQHGVNRARCIQHTLNRLAYERSELGDTPLYDGKLTSTIVKAFLRTHGTHSPVANFDKDIQKWVIASSVPLPLHIAEGKSALFTENEMKELMQGVGYDVPTPVVRKSTSKANVPLVNPTMDEAKHLQALWTADRRTRLVNNTYGLSRIEDIEPRSMTQEYFSARSKGDYTPFKTVEIDNQGMQVKYNYSRGYKQSSGTPICRVRIGAGSSNYYNADTVLTIEDKPQKLLPITWEKDEEEQTDAA